MTQPRAGINNVSYSRADHKGGTGGSGDHHEGQRRGCEGAAKGLRRGCEGAAKDGSQTRVPDRAGQGQQSPEIADEIAPLIHSAS